MKQVVAKVTSNQEVLPGVWVTGLHTPYLAVEAKPGQFFHLLCGDDAFPLLRRPLSLHRSLPLKGEIQLLFKQVGAGTRWLSRRMPGDEVDILGPLGNGFSLLAEARNLLLIAGGVGIAPLASLAEEVVREGKAVKLVAGATTGSFILPLERLPSGLEYIVITEDGSLGRRGLATDVARDFLSWADQVFACGPTAMLKSLKSIIGADKAQSNKSVQVSVEEVVACGVGACLGCVVKTKLGWKRVCADGPVFELESLIWR